MYLHTACFNLQYNTYICGGCMYLHLHIHKWRDRPLSAPSQVLHLRHKYRAWLHLHRRSKWRASSLGATHAMIIGGARRKEQGPCFACPALYIRACLPSLSFTCPMGFPFLLRSGSHVATLYRWGMSLMLLTEMRTLRVESVGRVRGRRPPTGCQ